MCPPSSIIPFNIAKKFRPQFLERMGHRKMEINPIRKGTSRRAITKNRKQNLLKKMQEFKTLCDVDACMIIYPPKEEKSSLEIWPDNPEEVSRIINLYKTNPNVKQKFSLVDFYDCKKKEIHEELKKNLKKHMETLYPTHIDSRNQYSEAQLKRFAEELDNKLDLVKSRIESIKGSSSAITDHDEILRHQQNKVSTMNQPPPQKQTMMLEDYCNDNNSRITTSSFVRPTALDPHFYHFLGGNGGKGGGAVAAAEVVEAEVVPAMVVAVAGAAALEAMMERMEALDGVAAAAVMQVTMVAAASVVVDIENSSPTLMLAVVAAAMVVAVAVEVTAVVVVVKGVVPVNTKI
ncbi:OLC1v1020525C1 [Oldenlandia corymbosa var. corymbosa]|uniref:OLC1v1020525C1 n=1 Tax=Oldenlandia corymbosa var. corymbosa TaxID=529605 RepID=A0AAV1EH65_OLDCO|nr:OLC1v1020525C1 [Oldenlandia corymbosa var. corymbosa]